MAGIVRGIVDGDGRAELVEVLHQHPLLVEVEDAHGPHHRVHAATAAPVLHGAEQGGRHGKVVHKLDEAEADVARVPLLVGAVVDDAGDAPHGRARLVVGHESLYVRKLQRGVLLRVKRLPDVRLQIGHITGIARIQPAGQMHEIIHFAPCLYLSYKYIQHSGDKIRERLRTRQAAALHRTFLGNRRPTQTGHSGDVCPGVPPPEGGDTPKHGQVYAQAWAQEPPPEGWKPSRYRATASK